MEVGSRKLQSNPRQKASLLSVIFFGWTIPFFKRTYGKVLNPNDVSEPLVNDRTSQLGDRLERKWFDECQKKGKPSLMRAVAKAFWFELMIMGILCFFNEVVVRLLLPYLLEGLLSYFRKNHRVSRDDALKYGTAIFIITISSGISVLHYFYFSSYFGTRVRVAVTSLIYRKLSQSALTDTAPGKLANLLSNDVNRFELALSYLHSLYTAPTLTILATYILWKETKWAGLIGLLIVFLIVPLQSYVGKLSAAIRFKTALRTDERVRFMDEIISGVQVIKMYVWEESFARLIAIARRLEIKEIYKNACLRGFNMTFNLFTTRMALFGTVLATVLMYGSEKILVSKIFMISYIFTAISHAMCQTFVRGLSEIGEVLVSFKRLQMFLEYEEKDNLSRDDSRDISVDHIVSQNMAVSMKNVSASWADASNQKEFMKIKKKIGSYKSGAKENDVELKPFNLRELNLEIPKGKLIFVIGPVGAGKSSLLQVLLKELPLTCGSMGINGTISYACQESWIFTSTVRQNITFGQPMDRLRYDEVVRCTALKTDFAQLSAGDMTVVGENGTGLSGGQKARVNLARAVYRKADIYLIDDPLSAVDSHVQSHLFDSCIGPKGFLARQNATRILITHQIHFLKEADWIVVLKNGKIETQGNYNDVLSSGIDIASLLNKSEENLQEEKNEDDEIKKSTQNSSNSLKSIGKSMEEKNNEKNLSNGKDDGANEQKVLLKELEASSKGKVKGSLIVNYFKAAQSTHTLVFLVVTFLLTQGLASFADIWISIWIRVEESQLHLKKVPDLPKNSTVESTPDMWSTGTYSYIYGGIMASLFVIAFTRSYAFFKFCAVASQKLHDSMFRGLISTKMRFFDTNPSGRIMNRFSKDLGSTDEALPRSFFDATQLILRMLGAILVTLFTNIKFTVVILIMGMLFWIVRKIYLKCSTNIKRLEATTKSPVFSHISATLSGLSTIRAFQAQQLLRQEFENHQDLNTGACFMFISTSYGFGMSLDLMVYIFIGFVIYFFILLDDGVTGDKVGLAITQSLSLTGLLQLGVRHSADVKNNLMSVERVLEYSQLEPEKQPDIPKKLPKDWPSQGKIEFKNVFYQYSNIDHEPVLRGLSFCIKSREKISIVGRTGAGKSSLFGAIFRLANVEGEILIDDVDTSYIHLNELRSKISIIPQEPILFSGTLRRNLDPFEEYSDSDLWFALESVGMKDFISDNNGLQMPVLARGQNFSTGQRQILCLARAILRKNRIIILDEATANVDLKTDEMIQRTIREKICDSTVITIAHRLYTVIDSDRILVMDAGVAVEFDEPYSLMQNKNGVFRKMVEALGPQEYDRLYAMAKDNIEK